MQKSLKKQIQLQKISQLIKTYDIVFLFAIFNLPQKKRQLLNHSILNPLLCSSNIAPGENSYTKTICCKDENKFFQGCARGYAKGGPHKPGGPSVFDNKICNKNTNIHTFIDSGHFFKTPVYECVCLKKKDDPLGTPNGDVRPYYKGNIVSLQICNKSIKHLGFNLPLYGQTLLVACRQEKHAEFLYKNLSTVYKGFFLGGFYKNVFKTKIYMKALFSHVYQKPQIYTLFFRVFSVLYYKNVKATTRVSIKTIFLYKCITKQEKDRSFCVKKNLSIKKTPLED